MKLSNLSIRRPVFASVMSIGIVLFGAISLTRLPVREYPNIDPPVVSVTTFYRGASANVVETEITNILEEEFATIEGIKTISSASQDQTSAINIEFELGRDVDQAANDVRDRTSRISGRLPREAEDPIIARVDADAGAIMYLGVTSPTHSSLELTEAAELIVKERLQRLTGVGSVDILAGRRFAMRVWLDPLRMAAHGIAATDVDNAVRLANAEIPSGRVEGAQREFSVRTRGELASAEEFARIIVAQRGADVVRLEDIADVTVGAEDDRSIARYNGQTCVGLGVVKQSLASTVEVARTLRAALPDIEAALPEGMTLLIGYDKAIFIEESISEVIQTIFIALMLVVFIVLVFLKSVRATLVPAVAIPISIIGTFTVLYFLGFTLNILTLLALVLSIGLVVDDAIVMLENVYRHMEMGKSRMQAAFDGAKEIGFAVVATTVALVAVFVPLSFLTGNVGRLFREFGIAVAAAVTISTFVALTLSPMLCSRILRPLRGGGANWASRSFDAFFDRLDRLYRATLTFVLRHRVAASVVALLLVAAGSWLFTLIPSELAPTEDRNVAFGIVRAPEGATLEYTDRYMRQIENELMAVPERQGVFSVTGMGGQVTNSFMVLLLTPRNERDRSQQEVVAELFPRVFSTPGVFAFLINPPSLGGGFNAQPISYVLQGDDYDQLNQATAQLLQEAGRRGILLQPDTDLELNKPQLDLAIDRDRAAALGVSVTDIGSALQTLLGGRVVSQFKRGAKQYDVVVQVRPSGRSTPDTIEEIYVRGDAGLVQLASVVNVSETVAPKALNHYNRQRAVTISANLPPGVGMDEALSALDEIAATQLPAGISTDLAGVSLEFRTSSNKLYYLFLFSVVFIYLVLAAQFESFIDPLTILLAVPLAVVGALFSLWVLGLTLNIYSQIGLIMLIGLVTKNSILIVEFANQLREQGRSIREAVVEASVIRLRPILMTSFATMFGVLPIALGIGAGGESRQPLGVAVVGGMLFSTFLALVLVPIMYSFVARFKRVGRKARSGAAELEGHVAPVPAV